MQPFDMEIYGVKGKISPYISGRNLELLHNLSLGNKPQIEPPHKLNVIEILFSVVCVLVGLYALYIY